MRRHAQLYITDHRGTVEAMGSDSIVPLDGRWNRASCEWATREQIERLSKFRTYTHFQIRTGRISNPRPDGPIVEVAR